MTLGDANIVVAHFLPRHHACGYVTRDEDQLCSTLNPWKTVAVEVGVSLSACVHQIVNGPNLMGAKYAFHMYQIQQIFNQR
jgi:hypothetical protein